MPYCTRIDIENMLDENELISLTDDADTGSVNTDVVTAVVADADAVIDTYLSGKYSTPMDPVPDIIRKLSVDISIYTLFTRRGRVSEAITQRYKDAISLLRDVSRGNAGIVGASDAPQERSDDVVIITSNTRRFTRSTMEDF